MRMILVVGVLLVGWSTGVDAIDISSQADPPFATAYIMPDESSSLGIRAAKAMACELASVAGTPLPIPFAVRQWARQDNGSYVPGDEIVTGQVTECTPRAPEKLMF